MSGRVIQSRESISLHGANRKLAVSTTLSKFTTVTNSKLEQTVHDFILPFRLASFVGCREMWAVFLAILRSKWNPERDIRLVFSGGEGDANSWPKIISLPKYCIRPPTAHENSLRSKLFYTSVRILTFILYRQSHAAKFIQFWSTQKIVRVFPNTFDAISIQQNTTDGNTTLSKIEEAN